MEGRILDIEGIDGAGKSVQAKLLTEALKKSGKDVVALSYPDKNSDYGKMLHSFLGSDKNLLPDEQFFLYLLDMIKDREKIEKTVESGVFVVLDRYFLSTLAYQSSEGFDFDRAKAIVNLSGLRNPDAVFYIDVPLDTAMARKSEQKGGEKGVDRFERNKVLLDNVRRKYEYMLSKRLFCRTWVRVDGSLPVGDINRSILDSLNKLLGYKL